ncbi:MAG: oligosaccharide flippase family protein [Elusimicrobiales bacterium]|jgi:O-antigen/teichoic acid export membrane protein
MTHSISRKIVRNTFFNTLGRVWTVLTSLILTPYIISRLGVERYGVLALLGGVTGYFGLFDFGISTSFVKYISEFYARKQYGKINEVVNTGAAFYFVFGAAVFAAAFFFLDPVLSVLKIPQGLYKETAFVFLAGVGIFSVSGALGSFASVPAGLQRMDIANMIGVAVSVPNIAGTVFVLEKGYGLPGLMLNSLATALLSNAANIAAAFRMLPELEFNLFLSSRVLFKKLFSFGYKLQVSRFANLVSFQTDKFLITGFLNIGLVAYYQLGSSIVSQARQIPLLLISALIPAVSELEAREDRQALIRMYLRGSKYLISLSTPLLLFVAFNASVIMFAWMGAGYERAADVIRFLCLGYYMATVTGVASSIAAGVARTDLDMKFGILMAVLNLALSVFLIIKFGFTGVLVGTSAALILSSLYYVKLFHEYLGVPVKEFRRLFLKPAAVCAVPVLATYALNRFLHSASVGAGRPFALFVAAFDGLLFFALYGVIILKSGYFDEYDRKILGERIPFARYVFECYAC